MEIITAFIDVRGSGSQHKENMFEVYRNLGTIEIRDIINVTTFLSKKFNCIDHQNIGIFGWKHGGFISSMTLENDPDSVFSCGILGIFSILMTSDTVNESKTETTKEAKTCFSYQY